MEKRQLINAIREINQTAGAEFLQQFDETSLQQYLDHLEEASQKRARYAGIVWNGQTSMLRMVS